MCDSLGVGVVLDDFSLHNIGLRPDVEHNLRKVLVDAGSLLSELGRGIDVVRVFVVGLI